GFPSWPQQPVDLVEASQNGGMERIVEMDDGLIGPVDDKIVLNQIICSETEEIHARGHQIAGLRRGGSLNHDADRDARIVALPLQIKLPAHIHDDLAGGVQIVDGGDERQQDPHSSVDRSAIQAPQLFFKDVGVLQTKSQPSHTEVWIDPVPTLLVDTDIDSPERDRRAFSCFQNEGIIRYQRLFVRLPAFAKEIEFCAVQANRFTSIGDRRADFLAEIDVGSPRNRDAVFRY